MLLALQFLKLLKFKYKNSDIYKCKKVYTGYIKMYEDIEKQKVLQEFQELVQEAKDIEIDVKGYFEFMKEKILNTYSAN